MADAQIQPSVKALMRTLLKDYPTLLDESDTSRLADVKACQRMGLKVSYPVLVAEGRPYDPKRYYVSKFGNWHLCSQWRLPNHRSNAESLLRFVEDLIKRKTKHPDVAKLQAHRGAFEKYLRSSDGTPPPTKTFRSNLSKEMSLWSEFLAVWPPARVREMSLEDYTNLNRDDAFVYWLEKRTEALGSIWGGSAFKFGIYRRSETSSKPEKRGRIWGEEHAWMRKYGETPEEAFTTVRSRLADVIDAVREGNLEAVEQVDFSPAVKWKVAFLYQDREAPRLLAIYDEKLLRLRHDEAFPDAEGRSRIQQHAALIEHYSGWGDILDISRAIWKSATAAPESDTAHPRNRILYGPPGTGKTYGTAHHAMAIIEGTNASSLSGDYRQRFRELTSKSADPSGSPTDGRVAMVTFHQNYAYEDFVEGIRPRLTEPGERDADAEAAEAVVAAEASASPDLAYELKHGVFRRICAAADGERRAARTEGREPERYVLVIDEINRGNIPKIFGELITLIEESRRLGGPDETTVTLPYSGDDFGVPENLYIIGTMNTADRSIQQLDTALRRRFTFVEMMPDPDHELIPGDVDGVDCRKMLRAMNERIVLLMDREHQIGHTYLLDVKSIEDLADRFRNRIFPLLQEYFYDDWRRIDAVLGGNAFVQPTEIGEGYAKDLAREFDLVDEEMVTYERLPQHDPAWEDAGQYRKIYEPVAAD